MVSPKAYRELLFNLWTPTTTGGGSSTGQQSVSRGDILRLVVAPDQTNLKVFCGEMQNTTGAPTNTAAPAGLHSKVHPSVIVRLYPTCFVPEDFDVLLNANHITSSTTPAAGVMVGLNTVTLSSSHWAKAMLKKMPLMQNRNLSL